MVRRLAVVATVAALLAGAGPADSAAPRGTTVQAVDAAAAPRGAGPAVPWLDATRHTIHDGSVTITLPFSGVDTFRRGGGGFVVKSGSDLYLARTTGTSLVARRLTGEFRVSTGLGLGTQVAYRGRAGHRTHRHAVIRVVDLATGHSVRTLRVARYGPLKFYRDGQPEAFYNGVVWTNLGQHLATWRPSTGQLRRLTKPSADSVDPLHGYAQHRVNLGSSSYSRFFPLAGHAAWTPWIVPDPGMIGWSSDGRVVATFRYSDASRDFISWVTLRDAQTGTALAAYLPRTSFYPAAQAAAAVESNGAVLVSAGSTGDPEQMALMRLGTDGTIQRTTDMQPAGTSPAIPARSQ